MRTAPFLLALLLWLGCATPLELGERRYREGDRLAALETWRDIDDGDAQGEAAARRIAEVEDEFTRLVERYRKRGLYYEDKERLAESVLNYRLALRLQPDDAETLSHVQGLARSLSARKQETWGEFQDAFARGRLADARDALARLRRLDPFDPEIETDRRQLDDALDEEVERYLARGRRHFTSGNLAAAERAFRAVVDLEPGNETAQGHLSYIASIRATAHGDGGDPPQLFASSAEIDAEGFYRNALAAERAGDPYAAIRYDLQALRYRPSHPGAGRHLTQLRQRLSPRIDLLLESGRSAFQQEDLQTAVDQWRRVLLIAPGNERAQEYLARAERLLEGLEQLRADDGGRVGRP